MKAPKLTEKRFEQLVGFAFFAIIICMIWWVWAPGYTPFQVILTLLILLFVAWFYKEATK